MTCTAGGNGVTVLPRLSLPLENRHGELRIRRFRSPEPCRTLAVAWRPGSPFATALRERTDIVRRAYPRRRP